MVDEARKAVTVAEQYVREMYGKEISDVVLEEIDTSKDGKSWLITVSFYRPQTPMTMGTLGQILGGDPSKRMYKVLNINKKHLQVTSMKMRAKVRQDDSERP